MSKIFKWNIVDIATRAFWDPSKGIQTENVEGTSLKERLRNPNGRRSEDHLADIGLAVSMMLDEIEYQNMTEEERFRHQVMGEWPVKNDIRGYVELKETCPECGDIMIENKKYVQCSGPHCKYIAKVK